MEAFYGYRLPGNGTETIAFRSCSIADGIRNGFAVAPFRQDRHRTLSFTGGEKADISGLDSFARRINITAPFSGSTTREQHRMEVERIVTEVKSGNLIKAVAARQLVMESEFSLSNTFLRLCLEYPEAFIFCFGSEATGIWLGASPETLVAGQRGLLTSMALAGTRSAEASGDWDDKNLKEHNVVRDFIRDAFESAGLDAETGPTHTAQAGPVEHLRTYITARIREAEDRFDMAAVAELALRLSPTPALCGFPVESAMRIIDVCENFDRSYYGGFFGPYQNEGDFNFFVNLRSLRLTPAGCALYAGGGINEMSAPDDEWLETENKLSTLLRCLQT